MTANAPAAGVTGAPDEALDAAFAEVLAAEQAAEVAVAACRAEAARRMAEAEAAAQRVDERAAVRRREWYERRAAALTLKVAELERQAAAAAESVALDDDARARLVTAVERLADELCGADGEAG